MSALSQPVGRLPPTGASPAGRNSDLANLYGVPTKQRNRAKFPDDFVFQTFGSRMASFKVTNCDLKGQRRLNSA